MKKLFNLVALLMFVMCAVFVSSCNDDVEETPPATVTPPDVNATENKDTHEYVDLGLPSGTLWATCNVGASKPEEYGNYYAWGETQPKNDYNWTTYKYCDGTGKKMLKYCIDSDYGNIDNRTELEQADDAATANWGSKWQMPSIEQFKELCNNNYTNIIYTTFNDVKGTMIVSKSNGNRIFLPAADKHSDGEMTYSYGYYWTSTLGIGKSCYAYEIILKSSGVDWNRNYRKVGKSIRPVRVMK